MVPPWYLECSRKDCGQDNGKEHGNPPYSRPRPPDSAQRHALGQGSSRLPRAPKHQRQHLFHPEDARERSAEKDLPRQWAERYERETGRILCELRVNHNARRAAGEYVKNDNLTRREYEIVRLYMEKSPDQIRTERSLQQTADRLQLQSRLAYRRQLFESKLEELYGSAREKVSRQISALEGQRDLRGLFAAIVRFKKRLTGEIARQERRIADLKRTRDNLDMRISEQRAAFERQHAAELTKLANRHRVERERDERLIAHARSRSERERMGLKARLNFRLRGDRDQTYVPKEEHKQILSRDLSEASTATREKRWSRKEGRGAHRTVGRARAQDRRRERD